MDQDGFARRPEHLDLQVARRPGGRTQVAYVDADLARLSYRQVIDGQPGQGGLAPSLYSGTIRDWDERVRDLAEPLAGLRDDGALARGCQGWREPDVALAHGFIATRIIGLMAAAGIFVVNAEAERHILVLGELDSELRRAAAGPVRTGGEIVDVILAVVAQAQASPGLRTSVETGQLIVGIHVAIHRSHVTRAVFVVPVST